MQLVKAKIQWMLCTNVIVVAASACSQRFAIEPYERRADASARGARTLDAEVDSGLPAIGSAGEERGTDDQGGGSQGDAGFEGGDAGGDAALPISGLVCGDGLRVETEACDLGNFDGMSVPCSSECLPTVVEIDAEHAGETSGVHPLALDGHGGALVVTSSSGAGYQVSLLVFDQNGAELAQVELDNVINDVIEPAVAVGPDGTVAAAWAAAPDSGGGTEVRLVTVRDDVVERRTILGVFGARRNVDLLAVGDRLVAAWAEGFSDVYAQEFDWDLVPRALPQLIAGEAEIEDAPSLVSHGSDWAVVWRQSDSLGERLGFATAGARVLSKAFVPGREGERLNPLLSLDGETTVIVHSVANELVGGSALAVTEFRRSGSEFQAEGPTTIVGTEGAYASSAARAADRMFVAWRQDSGTWWAELTTGLEFTLRQPFPSGGFEDSLEAAPKLAGSAGALAAVWVVQKDDDSTVSRTQWPLPWTSGAAEYPLSTPNVF